VVIFVAVTFVVIVAIVLTPYWLFIVVPERQAQHAVLKRLKVSGKPAAVRNQLVKAAERLSSIESFDAALLHSRAALKPTESLLAQADSRMTVGSFILVCALVATVTFGLVAFVTRQPLIALPLAGIAGWIPVMVVKRKRTKRIARFEELFPESLDLLARALRAGHAFTTGLLMAADEIAAPVGPEFRTIYDQQNYGMPMGEALKSFAERVPLLDAKFFVTAVMTQRESGGNLAEVLDNLSSVIRDRFKVKRQIQVISAHGRITGSILTAVPPVLGAVLFVVNPSNMKILITDPLGTKMLIGAIFLQVTGGLLIRRLVRIEY
jgi:tight adherence protein B